MALDRLSAECAEGFYNAWAVREFFWLASVNVQFAGSLGRSRCSSWWIRQLRIWLGTICGRFVWSGQRAPGRRLMRAVEFPNENHLSRFARLLAAVKKRRFARYNIGHVEIARLQAGNGGAAIRNFGVSGHYKPASNGRNDPALPMFSGRSAFELFQAGNLELVASKVDQLLMGDFGG
jgi:hypothetical protein